MNSQLMEEGLKLGPNRLPYELPIHPNLVHFTIGLFIIAIIFDIAGKLFPIEKPIFRFLSLSVVREGFFDVGWYNLLASAIISFFTVAAGFFEIMLADPPANVKSPWGLGAGITMILHGLGGIFILAAIVAMTVWRGLMRYKQHKSNARQVNWVYLLVGIGIMGIMYVQGTLGGHLGDTFGVHVTAAHLLRHGENPNVVLK